MTSSTIVPPRRAHTKRMAMAASAPVQKMIVAGITHCGMRVPAMTGPCAGSGNPESTGSLSACSSVIRVEVNQPTPNPRPRDPPAEVRSPP